MTRLLSILFLSLFTISVNAQDAKARGILDKMSAKYKAMSSFSANFAYGNMSASGKKGRMSTGSILAKGVKFKLNMAGQEIFNNGKELYTFVKETNEVNITTYDSSEESPFSPSNIYGIYKKGYNYKFVKEEKIVGKTVEVIELVPQKKGGNVSKIQIGVNKADKSIANWKIWDNSGKITVFEVSAFKPNVAASDASFLFNTGKYPGVEVIDLR
jgi:outer membrane lipoprotein carrier protein